MRTALIGAVVGAVVVLLAVGLLSTENSVFAERLPVAGGAGGLVVLHVGESKQGQGCVAVVDPQQRVIGVYQIDLASGEIAVTSVRNIHWDLQMVEFNSTSKRSPIDIQRMLGVGTAGGGFGL